ncbi:MAG: SDR family oxidoreductase [Planctomycetaceae bacterium]
MKLAGKTALVTGAGRGIGKGCALELARAGADIVLNDRPGGADAGTTAEEIRSLGRICHIVEADVFSRAGCEAMVAKALECVDAIDILISNPAFSRRGAFLDYSAELFEATINGTLTSGFHVSQLVARHMVERGRGGKIVFISSVQAELPMAGSAAYGAAKAGLNHLTMSIAVELASHRINVNVIEPGWIDTPGEHVTFSDETIAAEGARLPWQRMGLPEDIGRAAAFLVSDDADYITGTVLPVDGLFRFRHCLPDRMPPLKES